MKVAVAIAVLGVLALVASIVPLGEGALVRAWNAGGTDQAVMMIVAMVLAIGAGALTLVRKKLFGWQLMLAMASFVFVVTKLRVWETLPHFAGQPAAVQLLLVVALVGVIVSTASFVVMKDRGLLGMQ